MCCVHNQPAVLIRSGSRRASSQLSAPAVSCSDNTLLDHAPSCCCLMIHFWYQSKVQKCMWSSAVDYNTKVGKEKLFSFWRNTSTFQQSPLLPLFLVTGFSLIIRVCCFELDSTATTTRLGLFNSFLFTEQIAFQVISDFAEFFNSSFLLNFGF